MDAVRLVLWDIDHTLIATGGIGREIAAAAFETVTCQPMRCQAELNGRTERAIFAETLKLNGLDPDGFPFNAFAAALATGYAEQAERLRSRGRVLPGAAQALAALADHGGVTQTVVTGNVRPVAEIKLRVFDLAEHIEADAGGYGSDDHDDRAALVALAARRAAAITGRVFASEDVVIVGDTLADVAAGRANHARVIAVATGRDTAEDLRRAGADLVLPDLANTVALLRAVVAP